MDLLITIIVLALLFDYINGFHDAANAIATIVSTKVLTPLQAVIWSTCFNFMAFFIAKYLIGDFGIANTVSKTVHEQYITLPIILSGVIAAVIWSDCSHHLEPVDLVERNSLFFISYTYRWICRSRNYSLWIPCHSKYSHTKNRTFYLLSSYYRYACSFHIHSDSV